MRSRLSLLTISFAMLSLLAGCATAPRGTNTDAGTQQEVTSTRRHTTAERFAKTTDNELYNERIAQVSRDIRAICTSPANRPYYAKTPCLPSGMTEAHLKDGSRITPEARRVAERVFASLHKLNEDTRSLMISSGDAHLIKLARHSREMVDPKISALQSSLLKGAMTWAEYNRPSRGLRCKQDGRSRRMTRHQAQGQDIRALNSCRMRCSCGDGEIGRRTRFRS